MKLGELQDTIEQKIGRSDSLLILEHFLERDRNFILLHPEEEIRGAERTSIEDAAWQVKNGIPVQYVLKEAYFCDEKFYVDERVLIPRPETEALVKEVVDYLRVKPRNTSFNLFEINRGAFSDAPTEKISILDMCTGSGCIAASLAKALPEAEIVASDISIDALDVAQQNLNRICPGRVKLVQSDLFSNVNRKFDLIVSNPPYIPTANMTKLDPRVRNFEPSLALDGGEEGLNCIGPMVLDAGVFLKVRGALFLEIDDSHGPAINILSKRVGARSYVVKDINGQDRIAKIFY